MTAHRSRNDLLNVTTFYDDADSPECWNKARQLSKTCSECHQCCKTEGYASRTFISDKTDFKILLRLCKHANTVPDALIIFYGGINEELGTKEKKHPRKTGENKSSKCANTKNPKQDEPICFWEPHNSRLIIRKQKGCRCCSEKTKRRSSSK